MKFQALSHGSRLSVTLFAVACSLTIMHAQKKQLDHEDFATWIRIQDTRISNDGNWVGYELAPGEGDETITLYNVDSGEKTQFHRGENLSFTDDSRYAIFHLTPPEDSVREMRRRKVDDDDLPHDTLVICSLADMTTTHIPDVKEYHLFEEWAGHLLYMYNRPVESIDTTVKTEEEGEEKGSDKKRKTKKYSKKNGFPLVVREIATGTEDTLDYVTDHARAVTTPVLAAVSKGRDSTLEAGVYAYMPDEGFFPLLGGKGEYEQLAVHRDGGQIAFVADTDTTDVRVRPYVLYHWSDGENAAIPLADNEDEVMPGEWHISQNGDVKFSENGNYLHYSVAPEPVLEDTTLLKEEIVNVEVWHYMDERLYTQQSVRIEREKKRTYPVAIDLKSGIKTIVAGPDMPEVRTDDDLNSRYIIAANEAPYLRQMSWEGLTRRDAWLVDKETGETREIGMGIAGWPKLSPGFGFTSWYSRPDSAWLIHDIETGAITSTSDIPTAMYDELNDRPTWPWSNGRAGWLKNDEAFLVYDRYDIWKVDPTGATPPVNLTEGRDRGIRYRYIDLDDDEEAIDPDVPMLLYVFDTESMASGYASLDLVSGSLQMLAMDDIRFDPGPQKARDSDRIVFTIESFERYPDLYVTDDNFATWKRISEANPQQEEYRWGTSELFHWESFEGRQLTGMIIKPEDFDADSKYPVIVNFYERSSEGLHRYRRPYPGRSTINYSFFASRGYVIFNPDVYYEVGHPGQSAYDCVVSGVEALIEEGYVDTARIGVQGHSWGGYQIADLLTRTDIFACAESGAPVVNMVSAYGGIRWQTGLSRMFQYERTQSRLGATLWERPDLYIENSPIFNLDKITTPVLIMHNDNDGHVPWYQGIEFFVAMRRLGKPAWMLNYNDEPHWPLKLQNRKDFNIRLQQFFDYYLMDGPLPKWMKEGVPAVHKGILQGYEAVESDRE